MSPDDRQEVLIEATIGAHRVLDADGLPIPPPEWWDLSPEACQMAFESRMRSRAIERELHPRGWSTSVQAVMERLHL